MSTVPDRRRQHRLRALFKEIDERLVRIERILALLIDKGVIDRDELAAEGLLEPPLSRSSERP